MTGRVINNLRGTTQFPFIFYLLVAKFRVSALRRPVSTPVISAGDVFKAAATAAAATAATSAASADDHSQSADTRDSDDFQADIIEVLQANSGAILLTGLHAISTTVSFASLSNEIGRAHV